MRLDFELLSQKYLMLSLDLGKLNSTKRNVNNSSIRSSELKDVRLVRMKFYTKNLLWLLRVNEQA